jgi:hypothetical protein
MRPSFVISVPRRVPGYVPTIKTTGVLSFFTEPCIFCPWAMRKTATLVYEKANAPGSRQAPRDFCLEISGPGQVPGDHPGRRCFLFFRTGGGYGYFAAAAPSSQDQTIVAAAQRAATIISTGQGTGFVYLLRSNVMTGFQGTGHAHWLYQPYRPMAFNSCSGGMVSNICWSRRSQMMPQVGLCGLQTLIVRVGVKITSTTVS